MLEINPPSLHILSILSEDDTYDHREWRTGLPVRSAVLKPLAGRLVVGWVTTSESRLLYVFIFFIFCIVFFCLCSPRSISAVLHELGFSPGAFVDGCLPTYLPV